MSSYSRTVESGPYATVVLHICRWQAGGVRIEHPCRIIAGIVFEPSLRCCLAIASGGHSGFVECIYLIMVFRYKSNMHRLGIGPSFFEPEKSSFAVTKTPQIGVSVMAFVICKVCDSKWLQGLGVKGD